MLGGSELNPVRSGDILELLCWHAFEHNRGELILAIVWHSVNRGLPLPTETSSSSSAGPQASCSNRSGDAHANSSGASYYIKPAVPTIDNQHLQDTTKTLERPVQANDKELQLVLYADIQLPQADIALWRIFCRSVITAGTLHELRQRIDAEREQATVESEFVLKIRQLIDYGLQWDYILHMQDHAKPEYKDVWNRWVEVARYIIEGLI